MAGVIAVTDLAAIRAAWRRVFSTNDAFSWPFRETVEIGRVFYPTDGCHLARGQYSALVDAIQSVGETGFLLSVVESEGLSFLDRDRGHWSCDLPPYEEYSALDLTLENALYSKGGHWGVLISHEMHALVGGTVDFMAALDDRYREWGDDLRMLREAWSDNPNGNWLESTLSRVTP